MPPRRAADLDVQAEPRPAEEPLPANVLDFSTPPRPAPISWSTRGVSFLAENSSSSRAVEMCALELPPGAKLERVMGIEPTTFSLGS